MNDDMIKHMANRFLGWKLPEDFHPDNGISFEPEFNAEYMAKRGLPPMRRDPIGTNLFNAMQAEAMVRHMIEGLPAIAQGTSGSAHDPKGHGPQGAGPVAESDAPDTDLNPHHKDTTHDT